MNADRGLRGAASTITSWPSVETDLRNAGANWVDDEVVEWSRGPNTLVSSRKPDDLRAFCNTLVEAFGGDVITELRPRMLRRL